MLAGMAKSDKVMVQPGDGSATAPATTEKLQVRQYVVYWSRCAKQAARRNAAFANDWQWMFGIPIFLGLLSYFSTEKIEVIVRDHPILSSVLVALGAFVITWLIAFFVRLIRVPVEGDYENRKKIGDLESKLRTFREPNLVIEYRPEEGEPFVQQFNDITQYRISVRSPVPIPDAELQVNHIKIGDAPALSKLHLRPMHDRNPNGTKRVALKSDKEDHWDLISAHISGVRLTCIGSFEQILPPGDYVFELMASGGDRPPITKIVKLQVHKDNTVTLTVHDGQLSTRMFA